MERIGCETKSDFVNLKQNFVVSNSVLMLNLFEFEVNSNLGEEQNLSFT